MNSTKIKSYLLAPGDFHHLLLGLTELSEGGLALGHTVENGLLALLIHGYLVLQLLFFGEQES